VEGQKEQAVWAIDDTVIWADQSPAQIVQWMYHLSGVEGWSAERIAVHFNNLGVPTTDQRDQRVRKVKTQPRWRGSRIRNMLISPRYKGVCPYGRRAKKPREVVIATMPALVSEEIWDAAQATLARYRIVPRTGTRQTYLLRSVIRCAHCGSHYCGVRGRGEDAWYRCNGALTRRTTTTSKCDAKAISARFLETVVWNDIERYLRDPGELIDELDAQDDRERAHAAAEAERATLTKALTGLQEQRDRVLDLYVDNNISRVEKDKRLAKIDAEAATITKQLEALAAVLEPDDVISPNLREQLRGRLDEGLDLATRQEIVRLLVRRVTVHTTRTDKGKKLATLTIEYRFPGVVIDQTVTDSCRSYTQFHTLQRVLVA
jgi:site-specific DNA recombinase